MTHTDPWKGRAYVKAIKGITWRGQERVCAYEVVRDGEQLACFEVTRKSPWRIALQLANAACNDSNAGIITDLRM